MNEPVPLQKIWQDSGLDSDNIHIGLEDTLVTGVAYDSRAVRAGDLFVAIQGQRVDGATFALEAQERGAVAVVAQCEVIPGFSGCWIQTGNTREALAYLSASYYQNPSRELLVVGTTGTNGKTTTTYLMEGIFEEAGIPCGRVSSVSYSVGDEDQQTAERTTPESADLQAMLRKMVTNGRQGCVMEVSSHALELRRVDAIKFAAGIFTNLTRDHLDFHKGMPGYFSAKRKLFRMLDESSPAVVNVDDEYGRRLSKEVGLPVTYAIDSDATIRPDRLDLSLEGVELDVRTPRGSLHLKSPLPGKINAYNMLAAAAAGAALSLPFRAIERGLASVESVPGRMEIVSGSDDDVGVVIDFAHTDDALKGLLDAVRPLALGRLITVLGCGGDRDRTKRPLMGTVASRLSDFVVITSDNPRSEDPVAIAKDIEVGVLAGGAEWITLLDREEAITKTIEEACPGDVVVVAGKGHERYQVLGSQLLPFEDAMVARYALARRRSGSRVG